MQKSSPDSCSDETTQFYHVPAHQACTTDHDNLTLTHELFFCQQDLKMNPLADAADTLFMDKTALLRMELVHLGQLILTNDLTQGWSSEQTHVGLQLV